MRDTSDQIEEVDFDPIYMTGHRLDYLQPQEILIRLIFPPEQQRIEFHLSL
jgi:hypothetical protein